MRSIFPALALVLYAITSQGQDWPQKAVRIIVPFPAGGSADLMPRVVGERLSQLWGQPVIIDNRPGAAGNIGATAVFQAEPDGYTLARGNPGKLNYASQGSGTTSHLTAELFNTMAGGLRITHIPYKGTAPALADLLAGQVELMFDNLGVSLPHVRSGKLRALAVAGSKRFPGLPDVPALSETLPGFESVAWFGIVAPPKTPAAIAEKVAASVAEALKQPEVQKRLSDLSAEPMGLSPAATAAFMKQETERWGAVIRAAGVKLE